MKNKKKLLLLTFLFLIVILFCFLPKHIGRFFYWNFADLNDYKRFPSLEIKKGEHSFTFFEADGNFNFKIPTKFDPESKWNNFEKFLEKKKAVAFLIVRNDTLIYENYFAGYNDTSILTTFSAAKAFVSALMGIAIDEGTIYSTSEPIVKYLPELTNPGFDKITIEDLLNMRSGIKFNEGYFNPFAEMPKYYYGTNILRYIKKLKVKEKPDKTYDYISVNTILLSVIIERATGIKLNKYLEQKIWQPIGMQFNASWSIDSEKHQTIKSNCCLNGQAVDFAKFGRLYLNKGNWEGNQVVPEKWVDKSTSIINDSRDSQGYPYTYQWRVLENGAFFAKGILGQYIFVFPEKNLIFVRIGKNYGNIDWADFFVELSKQL
ncbi:MAG: beta-lactamase family protein [Bacteroidales bacterium]|nr:beta-lactamase family protein [Bacteroidales bacterium]